MATDNKYDRQLRLWGASGQKALSETTVVLVRCSAAGTETLKNLVLPGIGSFCVVDDRWMEDENNENIVVADHASNFFLPKGGGGASRPAQQQQQQQQGVSEAAGSRRRSCAETAMTCLQELNPDCTGSFRHVPSLRSTDFGQLLSELTATAAAGASAGNSSGSSVLVIAADLEPPLLQSVAAACRNHRQPQPAPCIAVWSYGLLGVVRLQSPPAPLLQPRPRSTKPDLRLVRPFAGLQQLAASLFPNAGDWEAMDNKTHGHVPYPLVLMRLIGQYRAAHGGQLPQTFAEKQSFQASIKEAARNWDMELNFQEAQQNAYLAYTERELDLDHLRTVHRRAAEAGTRSARTLERLLAALFVFLERNDGQPPLVGKIPDLHSSTELYVRLQKVYQEKAAQDRNQLRNIILEMPLPPRADGATAVGAETAPVVSEEDLTLFCHNLDVVGMFSTRTVEDEFGYILNRSGSNGSSASAATKEVTPAPALTAQALPPPPAEVVEELGMVLAEVEGEEGSDQTPLLWYLGFSACLLFYQEYGGRYPGVFPSSAYDGDNDNDDKLCQQDVVRLQACLSTVLQHYRPLDQHAVVQSTLQSRSADYAAELVRYANAEIHNVAAVIGGVASQEAVKLITGQYVPLDNTYIYNGIASTGGVYRF